MLTTKAACEIARALPEVSGKDHFGSDAFYANKRLFATVWHDLGEVNVKVPPDVQADFFQLDAKVFAQIKNGFGRMGWTTIRLKHVSRKTFTMALETAWGATKKPKAKAKVKAKKKKTVRK